MARKKKAYGKRYSESQKIKMVQAWLAAASQTPPKSKNSFVKEHKVSAITLNGWIKKYAGSQANSDAVIVVDGPSRALALTRIEDEFATTMQAIREHQASIAQLRERLRSMVDAI